MPEIIDFLIQLLSVFKVSSKDYRKKYARATYMTTEEQRIVKDCFEQHLVKESIKSDVKYSYVYVVLRKKRMKIVALDNEYKSVFYAIFKPRFSANWKYGKCMINI